MNGDKTGIRSTCYDVLSLPTETESIQRGVNGNHNGEPPWGNDTGKRYGDGVKEGTNNGRREPYRVA